MLQMRSTWTVRRLTWSTHFFLGVILLFHCRSFAQGMFGDPVVITRSVEFGQSVYAADFDGDGDMDVLSASQNDHKIAWYENIDGLGTFGEQRVIKLEASAQFAFAADLDGDGDMDVLSASITPANIAWYENTDGHASFGEQKVISSAGSGAQFVLAADLDGDGDMDVLTASFFDSEIAWYENDGSQNFTPHTITTDAAGANSVFAVDVDGDGDIDVLSASRHDNKIAWYENTDSLGTFGPQRIITSSARSAFSVYAADLDGDGDMDVLSASISDTTGGASVRWFENMDGQGNFGPQRKIETEPGGVAAVHAEDLDGDGDMDVLAGSPVTVWYENTDGLGNFGERRGIGFIGARHLHTADLDGDGDMDVLAASTYLITWHPNLSEVTSVSPTIQSVKEFLLFPNYPNPFNPETTIIYELPRASAVKLEILNVIGQKIVTLVHSNQPAGSYSVRWQGKDASGQPVSSGVYLYQLQAGQFVDAKKMLFLR